MHTHSIYKRVDGVYVPMGHSVQVNHDQPLDSLIRACDDLARNAAKNHSVEMVFAYKVDNEVEYFISSVFYKWPNFVDRDDRNAGKQDSRQGQARIRSSHASRRPRSDGQSRA